MYLYRIANSPRLCMRRHSLRHRSRHHCSTSRTSPPRHATACTTTYVSTSQDHVPTSPHDNLPDQAMVYRTDQTVADHSFQNVKMPMFSMQLCFCFVTSLRVHTLTRITHPTHTCSHHTHTFSLTHTHSLTHTRLLPHKRAPRLDQSLTR